MSFIPRTTSLTISRGLMFCVLLVTLIAVGTFGFVRGRTNRGLVSRAEASANPVASMAMMFQGNSSPTRVDSAHITLRSTGFEPNEITRQAGPFLLAVDNVTGMGEMSFRLLNRAGARVRDFPAKGRFRLRKVVDLPPGRYALVETSHPEWICRITVAEP